jgi:hypothetical protein
MLKKPSSFVLASLRGSTYPQGVRLASSLAAAALDDFLNILLGELEERLMIEERLRLRLSGMEKVKIEVKVEWGRWEDRLRLRLRLRLSGEKRRLDVSEMNKFLSSLNLNLNLNLLILR